MRTLALAVLSVALCTSSWIAPALGQRDKPGREDPGDGPRAKPELVLPPQAIVRLTTGLDSSGNATHIHPVSFAPDGSTLAWGDRKDHTIRIWNVRTYREEWKLHGHESHILCTAYSPDGLLLASGSYDGSVRTWDLLTGRTLRVLRPQGQRSMVDTIAFAPDGKTIASGEWGGALYLWDVASGGLRRTLQEGGGTAIRTGRGHVQTVAFSPDGKTLASGSGEGVVKLWDAATGKEREKLRRVIPPGTNPWQREPQVWSLDFSPDGKVLAAACYGTAQGIYLWDTQTGEEARKLDGTGSAYTIDFSPDGKYLLSAARNLRVWELASGKTVLHIEEPRELLYSMYSGSFSPDGTLLCAGGQDNAVILWDAFGLERGWEPPEAVLNNLKALWEQLADSDPAQAYRAIGILSKLGRPAVAMLSEELRAVENADPRQIQQWIRDLDSSSFETREKAERELARVGELAEPGLRKALGESPSVEVRLRATRLLRKVLPTSLTRSRAVIVLENVGSLEARRVLNDLAAGDARAPLTREARASLERLARRPAKGR